MLMLALHCWVGMRVRVKRRAGATRWGSCGGGGGGDGGGSSAVASADPARRSSHL